MYRISVIIPAHNCEDTIEQCLRSLISQAEPASEIIVVDDASTDATLSKVEPFCQGGAVRILRNPQRMGASHSRNRGILAATAEWLMFVDGDDELPPGAVSALTGQTEIPCIDVIVGAHLKRVAHATSIVNSHGLSSGFVADASELLGHVEQYTAKPYIYTLLVHCWGKLYRKALIEQQGIRFDETLEQLEDVNFNFKVLNYCRRLSFVNEVCYVHNIGFNANSMSTQSGMETNSVLKISRAYSVISTYLTNRCGITVKRAENIVGQLLFTTVVIWLLRIGKKFKDESVRCLAGKVGPIVRSPLLYAALPAYRLRRGDSILVYFGILIKSSYACALALKARNQFNGSRKK
jgi:glycosyltransferase involved in cell wall biosynthesis